MYKKYNKIFVLVLDLDVSSSSMAAKEEDLSSSSMVAVAIYSRTNSGFRVFKLFESLFAFFFFQLKTLAFDQINLDPYSDFRMIGIILDSN